MTMTLVDTISKKDEIGRIVQEELTSEFCKNYILYGKEKTCFAEEYLEFAEDIKNFEVRDDDIWICTYPKAGSTWSQEMIWLLVHDLDYTGAQSDVTLRVPFLEACTIFDMKKLLPTLDCPDALYLLNTVKHTAERSSPRLIKTHLPYYLLPDQILNKTKNPKIIYIWRNPKDTCISFFHHGNFMEGWNTNAANFAQVFLADKARYGSYWKHIFGYWNQRHHPNVLIVKYEDMKNKMPNVLERIAKFLGKVYTDEQIATLTEHLRFETMKKNPYCNRDQIAELLKKAFGKPNINGEFLRAGTVGNYKENLSKEIIEKFDKWIKENVTGTDLEKYYDFTI